MASYSEDEKKAVIRSHFGAQTEEKQPACPHCGEELWVTSNYRAEEGRIEIFVHCPDCGGRFSWIQERSPQPWKPIQLAYLEERYRAGEVPRCPADDCRVTILEFSDGVLEFRCPYCNRRGRTQQRNRGARRGSAGYPGDRGLLDPEEDS